MLSSDNVRRLVLSAFVLAACGGSTSENNDVAPDVTTSDELPAAPDQRAEATAIIDEAKAINAERMAGRFDGLSARADVLLARARALAHNPTLTRALAVRWRVAATAGKLDLAQVFMREVTEVAARSGNDDEAAKTWALMARFAASFQGQPDEGKVMIASARSALARMRW